MKIYRNEDSNQVIFEGVEVQAIPCNIYQAEIVDTNYLRISDKTSPDSLRIVNKVLFSEVLNEAGTQAGATPADTLNYLTRQLDSTLSTAVYNAGRLDGLYLSVENDGDNIKVTAGKALVLVGDTLKEVVLQNDFIFNLADVTPNGNDKVFSIAMTGEDTITVTEIAGALNGAAIPADIRTESFLGIAFYNDFQNKFTFIQTLAPTAKNVGSTVYDLIKALNPKVLPSDRPIITKSTASDMRLGIGSGRVFAFGSNLITGTDTNPNIFTHPANTDVQALQIAEPNGSGLWQINQLGQLVTFAGENIWTKYDDGSGTLQDTPANHWVLMPVTLNCGQIQQGPVLALPTVYASQKTIPDSTFRLNLEVEAVNALQTFNFPNLTLETSAIIGVIAMRNDATNLADTDKVKIFSGDAEYLTGEGLTRVFQAIENVPIYDIYVSEGADPSTATGSIANPFNSLSSAVAAVPSGGSIFINGSITVDAEVVLPNKSISFFGSSDAEIKYASYAATNGHIIYHDGDNTAAFDFNDITFRNAGGYALLILKTEEVNIRNCEFYNNGWNGQALNTVLPSSTSGLLGYDSTNTDLQAFYAGANASNGGAVRIQECRKPLIRESRAEGNLRGFRLQDCGINGGGFVIENQAIGNIESGFYLAAGSLSGCQNVTVAVNYSAYNANNGLLVIGGLNNKFSQNEVNGNWNAGFCAWGAANSTLRDCGLYDNNRSQYNGIGNTGDARASIQINEAYDLLGTTISLNANARFIAEILDTQVHYTGLGSSTDKIGVLITEDVGLLVNDAKNIIKIDDVGFIGQDYAIDFSEVDLTNLKVSLGDNSYQSIGEKAVRPPSAGSYFELPYSNHVTNINYIDFEVNNTGGIIAKEGVNGNVINPYQVNQLQAVAYNSSIRVMLKESNKIQFEIPVANTSINSVQVNSVLNQAITQLNNLFTNTQGFGSTGNPVTAFALIGNDLTITLQDSTSYTVDVTTLGVDENKFVTSGALNGSNLELTMNDSSVVVIDASNMINGSQLPARSNDWFIAYGTNAGDEVVSPSVVASLKDKQPFYNGDFLERGEEYVWTNQNSGFSVLGIYTGSEETSGENIVFADNKWSANFKFISSKLSAASVGVDVASRFANGYDLTNNTVLALTYDSDNYLKLYDVSDGSRVLIGQSNTALVGTSQVISFGGENQPDAKFPVMIKRFSQWEIAHDFDNSETSIIDGIEEDTVIKSILSISAGEKVMVNINFAGRAQRFGIGYNAASSGVTNAHLSIENSFSYGVSEQLVQQDNAWNWNTSASGYNAAGPNWSRGNSINLGMISLVYNLDNSLDLYSEDLGEVIATKKVDLDGSPFHFFFGVNESTTTQYIPSISKQAIGAGSQPVSSFAPDISNQSFDITEGQAFSVQIALDSGSDIVNQYVEQDAPAWAVLNQSTGLFMGTAPAFGSSNTYIVNCKAANAVGGHTNFTITFNVTELVYTNTRSLMFEDGVNSYLGGNAALVTALERSGNGAGSSDAWSVGMWIKRGSSTSGQSLFYYGHNDITNNGHIEIRLISNGRIRLKYGSANNQVQVQTDTASSINTSWNHVFITYSGGTTGASSGSLSAYYSRFKIFINGVLATVTNSHQNFGWSGDIIGQNFRFGRYVSGNYPKDLLLNQLAVWNSDQSANITDIYNSGDTQDLSLLSEAPDHYYEIENSVTSIEDLVGTAHFVGYNFNSSDLVTDTP